MISLVLTAGLAGTSFAASGDQGLSECKWQAFQEDERSRSIAVSLLAQVEPYWNIATTKTADRMSISRVDDPSGSDSMLDFYEVRFKQFEAAFYRNADGSPIPFKLSTRSSGFKLPCGLKMGQSPKSVIAILGSPTFYRPDTFVYATGGDINGEVNFQFEKGRLRQVIWYYDAH